MRDRLAGLRRFATIPNLAAVTVIAASIAFGIQTITTHKASTKAQTAKKEAGGTWAARRAGSGATGSSRSTRETGPTGTKG
jgi:hypothetical protein